MKTKNIRRIVISVIIILAIAIVTILAIQYKTNPSVSNNQKVQVVAAENFWGNIVSQIGGDHIEVTSIISDPSTDPHLYESNAHDAAALARANLVINNGLGYDDFMDKLLSVSHNDSRQVLSVDKILNITGDNPNPHLWYDILRVGAVADAFEEALAAKDPSNTNAYKANLTTFKNSLKPILDTIQEIKTKYPNAPVAYTERVPGYLLTAAGLDAKTPTGFAGAIEEGNDPSPADTATMDVLMTNRSIRILLYNAQATSSVTEHVRDLAKQAGIPVVGVTETLPKGEPTYQSWQLDQVKSLLKALEG
ncbi:MAG: periplasmic solute binding protein [Candidatus Saccharibacteria bacterium]|nr:periplasmic solute binding protein [Candidatus Saccharibacteria bacterium]